MENMYRYHSSISCSDDVASDEIFKATMSGLRGTTDDIVQVEAADVEVAGSEMSDLIKAQIANHPLYPVLVSAHIECQKVGAPAEMASLLDDINKESHPIGGRTEIGTDPELDEFMESYCEVLHKYKEEVSRPFDEVTSFLSNIKSQLTELCKDASTTLVASGNYISDGAVGTSEEDFCCGEVETAESQESYAGNPRDHELKEMLLRKYSGYLSSLRKEFLKKRKKGKLPKDARMTLMDWWNSHYRWPYPTEDEKMKLSEMTGLDQKQINNWFINQRKRHWKPSEDTRFALREGVSSSIGVPMYFNNVG
ncbi:hypothetical protein NMG60_11020877 [Bertholletia excelsa]